MYSQQNYMQQGYPQQVYQQGYPQQVYQQGYQPVIPPAYNPQYYQQQNNPPVIPPAYNPQYYPQVNTQQSYSQQQQPTSQPVQQPTPQTVQQTTNTTTPQTVQQTTPQVILSQSGEPMKMSVDYPQNSNLVLVDPDYRKDKAFGIERKLHNVILFHRAFPFWQVILVVLCILALFFLWLYYYGCDLPVIGAMCTVFGWFIAWWKFLFTIGGYIYDGISWVYHLAF